MKRTHARSKSRSFCSLFFLCFHAARHLKTWEEEREEDADALEASREAALCTPLLARAKFLLNEVRVAREAYISPISPIHLPCISAGASARRRA